MTRLPAPRRRSGRGGTGSRSSPPCCSRSPPSPPRGAATRPTGGTASRPRLRVASTPCGIEAAREHRTGPGPDTGRHRDVHPMGQRHRHRRHRTSPTSTRHASVPEFRPAFDAWLATDPLTNPDAPPTPFAMDDVPAPSPHRLRAARRPRPTRPRPTVRRNLQRAANYVLAVVLFAVALFFAGMSTKLHGSGPRKALLLVGCAVFIGTAVWIATFPVNLAV